VARRDEIFAAIPPSYNGWLHFLGVNAMAWAAIGGALHFVRAPSVAELLVVPLAFLFANAGEWQLHKGVLHRRVRGLGALYERHALTHHVAFHHDTMAAPSTREWRWVLFPAPALLGMLVGISPIVALLWASWSRNAGLLFAVTAVSFFLLYEWCHLSYHQPEESWVGRLGLVRVLRRHHQRHHHPALAKRYNFNVTFPIWDLVRGSMAPPDAVERADREMGGRRMESEDG
jgi:sterol desaturase/sphingolipid hydroxylase (fatty acid hydroxylase superfamily)